MKRAYVAPKFEIEYYELDASIAANCDPVVDLGPGGPGPGQGACDFFDEIFGDEAQIAMFAAEVSFYETDGICSCTYSSGGEGYFTS